MMKRSGLQARQLGGQGPYSSLALRAGPVAVSTPPPGPTVVPAAAATSSSVEAAAPLADIIIKGNNSTSNITSLKEPHHQTTTFESAAAAEISSNCSKAVESYHCGVSPSKVIKPALSSWRWNCFMPWESSYTADVSIDMEKHHYSSPKNFTDKLAYYTVQTLKIPVNFFFQKRHISHAILLETVAAIPGMIGAMLLHLKSLRRFEHSGGWIKALLEESDNERMHLMTFVELVKPKRYEQVLVIAIQCAFFIAYFLAYVVSPKLAHRLTGYIEEEAVIFYTEFLKDIDNGRFENMPAPQIAIDYWRLPHDSTLRDVVVVIRADQARHRDLNHYASDIYCREHELKEAPLKLDTTYKLKLHEFDE